MIQPNIDMSITFQKENLSYMVEEYIKDKILRGIYKEGDRVIEMDIANELGISRGPVREAMKIVEQEGIITSKTRRGACITKFDERDIQEVFEIRVLLENSILEDLIRNQKLSEVDYKNLNNIVDDMVKIVNSLASSEEILLALNKKDIEFHQYVWMKSGSKRKKKILDQFFFQLRLAMLYDTKLTEDLIKTATDHYDIVRYLQENDLENCSKALKDHMVSYYDYMID